MTQQQTLKEAAQAYEPKKTQTVDVLEKIPVDLPIEDREGKDEKGSPFNYKVVIINGEEFRMPYSVLGDIKTFLENKPDIKAVKVIKKGSGMNTKYTTMIME